MYSVAVTLVCWLCAVFTSTLRYFLTICFLCLGKVFSVPGSSTNKNPRRQVTCQVLSLRSNVVAVTMDYYSQTGHSRDHFASGPFRRSPHFRAFNQRRYWGRPSAHWPQDENLPHDLNSEYERPLPHRPWSPGLGYRGSESNPPSYLPHFSNAERRPKNTFQYSFFTDTNTDSGWPHTTEGNTVYPQSAQEVCVSVYDIII